MPENKIPQVNTCLGPQNPHLSRIRERQRSQESTWTQQLSSASPRQGPPRLQAQIGMTSPGHWCPQGCPAPPPLKWQWAHGKAVRTVGSALVPLAAEFVFTQGRKSLNVWCRWNEVSRKLSNDLIGRCRETWLHSCPSQVQSKIRAVHLQTAQPNGHKAQREAVPWSDILPVTQCFLNIHCKFLGNNIVFTGSKTLKEEKLGEALPQPSWHEAKILVQTTAWIMGLQVLTFHSMGCQGKWTGRVRYKGEFSLRFPIEYITDTRLTVLFNH